MRKTAILAILLIFVEFAFAQSRADDELICKEGARAYKMLQARSAKSTYYGYNAIYNRCFWQVNPYKNEYLIGRVTSVFKIDQTSDSIGFDLLSNMQVDSILWHGNHIAFSHISDKILVKKPGKWQAGITDSLTIFYQGKPDIGSGFGYYKLDFHKSGPIVYTLSEPYGADYWWPCKQTLNDKTDSMDIFISVPPSMKAGSNGKLISNDSINDSTRIFHWKSLYPIATYLVSFAVSNYVEFTNYEHFYGHTDSMPVVNYIFPESEKDARDGMPILLKVLHLYDSLFVPYPFAKEKYGHAQFTWGGGMEHQTMSSVTGFSFDLLSHELAHQWFGDKVTCGTWADLWLNEGFATYLNALCFWYLKPKKDWLDHMEGIRSRATSQNDGSVFAIDTVNINVLFSGNLRYDKGAFVIHMLRIKLGDSVFYSALRKYMSQSSTANGFARTNDLKTRLEQESGKNLDTFFNRWLIGEGFPNLKIDWQQSGNNMVVAINQKPSHSSVPFFELKIPIEFKNTTMDTIIYFSPQSLDQTFNFTLPFSVDTALFDPEITVLSRASLGGLNLDKTKKGRFLIAPNPANDKIQIHTFYNLVNKIQIFDITGNKMYETGPGFSHKLGENIVLDVRNFSSGTYITRIETKNSVTSLKFLKQ